MKRIVLLVFAIGITWTLAGGGNNKLSADSADKKKAPILPDLTISSFTVSPDHMHRDTHTTHLEMKITYAAVPHLSSPPDARNFNVIVYFMPVNDRGYDLSGSKGWKFVNKFKIKHMKSGTVKTIKFKHYYPEGRAWPAEVWRAGVTFKYKAIVDDRNAVRESNEKNNIAETEFFFV